MAETRTNPAQQILGQLKVLWTKQPRQRRVFVVILGLGIVAVIAVSQLASRSARWTVVAETGPDDAQELYATLAARDLPVRLREGRVEVDADRLPEARAIAAAAGLPRSGKGFELFDGSSLGQSSFAEQVNYRRALQGELARSITALAQVESARVHIALGKRSVFKDQDEPASASVALHLHPGQALAAAQVGGVRQLVAASIEGLKGDAVVVVDHHGNLLDAASPGTHDKRADLERSLTARIRMMLERVVGSGKVSVVTTAVVDESRVSETQELYDQTNPVLRSEARTIEGDPASGGIGGLAGTRGNLPGAPAASPTPGEGAAKRLQETRNYEVNKTVRQTAKPDVQLKRLHVAIVVDHKVGSDGKPVPRTDAELSELSALARQAAGIDESRGDKIEVRSIPFALDSELAPVAIVPPASELPMIPIAVGAGAFVLMALVAGIAIRARRRRRRARPLSLALPAPIAELERVLDAQPTRTNLDLPGIPEPRSLPAGRVLRDRVLEVVRGDAERTAEVLTAWLSETSATRGAKP